ncbi:carbohydrate sulfotransferase 11-like isoform X2 [Cylas formicarius]|uniref:carbohydrate sulfotransferase 11-like isoform X2 n=1 Tax=Cylas formicarius TaxID=197179 RepID=UPI002958B5EE|nr:carbohydrate sulfotransferase 11-like isoform X2 [Cylas formicarius]
MRLRKRRRNHSNGWKVIRRCVFFFTAVCLIPVLLVLLVATDHYMRPVRHVPFNLPQMYSEENLLSEPSKTHNFSLVAKRLEMRRKHLKKVCKILGLDKPANDTLHKPNAWEFLINVKHRLVWCNVFKAASTSWMYNFNILAGYSPKFLQRSKVVPVTLARQKYPRPSLASLRKALKNSISFIIARHPFERLLSAYRDKLQFSLPHTYHRKLGKEIICKYRREKNTNPKWPTYSEFVEYLVDSVKRGDRLDMHWAPVVEFCTPCMFDIKIIAHTETLQEDQMYLINKAGLNNIIKPQWKNAGKGATMLQIEKYYSQLTRSQILQLYHIYRFDFELFNYSLSGYLELGRPDKDPSVLLAAITMKDSNANSMPQIY